MRSSDEAHRTAELRAISWLLRRRLGVDGGVREPRWRELDPQRLSSEAVRHRVVGLVVSAPDADLLPEPAHELLNAAHLRSTLRAMNQAAELSRLLIAFETADIRVLLSKGQAFSVLTYGDWAVRGASSDADFIVAGESLLQTHRLMSRLGYVCHHDSGHEPPLTGVRGSYNRWLHYERYYTAPNRLHLDVHWRPVPGALPWTRFERLWADRTYLTLHGRQVAAPGPVARLRIAAGQGEPDGWRNLRAACDVIAAEAQLTPGELDELTAHDRLVAIARRRAREVLAWGNPAWGNPEQDTPNDQRRREWDLRYRTDRLPQALARSALGQFLPARRFMPMEEAGSRQPGHAT